MTDEWVGNTKDKAWREIWARPGAYEGPPKATHAYSVDDLRRMGVFGIYAPRREDD